VGLTGVQAYQEALDLFDSGHFFEAHEALEFLWLKSTGNDRNFLKGLIQLAVCYHHAEVGNATGTQNLGTRARLRLAPYAPAYGGIDVDQLLANLLPAPSDLPKDPRIPRLLNGMG